MITAEELQRLLPPNSSAPTPPPKDTRSKQSSNLNIPFPPLPSEGAQWRDANWETDRYRGSSRKKITLPSIADVEQSVARFQARQCAFEDAVRATMREIAPYKLDAYEAALALEKKNVR